MRLVFVRHGEIPSNVSGALDTGRPGPALTARGREQVRALADRWEREVAAPPVFAVVSPLLRTRQTAAPLLSRYGLPGHVRPGIREIRSGDVEMDANFGGEARYFGTLTSWLHGDLEVRMPGAESGSEVRERFLPVLHEAVSRARELGGEDAVAVVVAHGALNRFMCVSLARDLAPRLPLTHRMENATTSVLELPAGARIGGVEDLLGAFRALTWRDRPMEEWAREDPAFLGARPVR